MRGNARGLRLELKSSLVRVVNVREVSAAVCILGCAAGAGRISTGIGSIFFLLQVLGQCRVEGVWD